MINNTSLRATVYRTVLTITTGDIYDDIMLGALLFSYSKAIMINNKNSTNDMVNTVNSYKNTMLDKLNTIKNTYISYNIVRNNLIKNNYTKLTDIDTSIISKISTMLTHTNVLKEQFSSLYFNTAMYNTTYNNIKEYNYLKYVHENIMCKIFYYYKQNNNISNNDFIIYSSTEVPTNPGKIILFKIINIENTLIVTDILSGNIDIEYYEISIYNNYVKLTTI